MPLSVGLAGISGGASAVRFRRHGSTDLTQGIRREYHWGIWSYSRAILGGLALGVVETFGAAFISVPYKDALAFAMLLLFLLVRPQGLFGEKISEKAMSATASSTTSPVVRSSRWRGVPVLLMAVLAVILASALVPQQGYTLNIIMQAATYAVAVARHRSCTRLLRPNLPRTSGFLWVGAYGVALGTVDYGLPFFVALVIGVVLATAFGLVLGLASLPS